MCIRDRGTTEVTQSHWFAVMNTKPWVQELFPDVKDGPNYPASFVTWEDAMEFCKRLSAKEGKTYSLPTEAEWELACRAKTQTAFSFGDDEARLSDFAWFDGANVEYPTSREVGLKRPNGFELYDMHGNLAEWCLDCFAVYPESSATDPVGPKSGLYRVVRGGNFMDWRRTCRSASREMGPDEGKKFVGFRVKLAQTSSVIGL